ncbi:MAG TPA: GNAT family N-acetyltransferase [Acetobacteraceae bacterium]|nr:GNAT family N-acetyltransferase [Acetobacteraceae bacterium]
MDALRRATPGDAAACGRICYDAFSAINDAHGFAREFPSVEITAGLLRMLMEHPGFYGVVAERDGAIIGSNFLDERSTIVGVGPISVDPAVQNQGVGRRLMQDVIDRAASRHVPGVRLCQAAFHRRSLCLYTTMGFRTREPLSVMNGPPLRRSFAGYHVRAAEPADLDACNAVCFDVHGFDRGGELNDAIGQKTATVVERDGRISGYATAIGFFAHSVARSNQDLMALIAAATEFTGPGFLLPTRNYEVFAWCLASGLRLVEPMTLMTTGLYNEPTGAYLVNVLY